MTGTPNCLEWNSLDHNFNFNFNFITLPLPCELHAAHVVIKSKTNTRFKSRMVVSGRPQSTLEQEDMLQSTDSCRFNSGATLRTTHCIGAVMHCKILVVCLASGAF